MIGQQARLCADARLSALGLQLTFGAHVDEVDDFGSSSVQSRVADLHAAFTDPHVDGILTVIGGFNSNQLLNHLDFDLVGANPKVFCGFSDITALSCAIAARTGLVTYSGPHYSTFGMRDHFYDTLHWFTQAVFSDEILRCAPSMNWTDDAWYADQENRNVVPNDGWWTLNDGVGSGRLIGGNLCTLNLLQGTSFMPSLAGSVVFVEDDHLSSVNEFDRNLQSLLQLPDWSGVTALLIGRFQRKSNISRQLVTQVVASKPELAAIPVVANMDFGHTMPLMTIPVGGWCEVAADDAKVSVAIR